MMALTAKVSCCVFRVLVFNSNLFNFGPPSPSKLNPNGRVEPKLDGINNSGLKCYWAFVFFSFLRKTMDWGFYIYYFLYLWMIKLYLVTCFSCDNMTYRLGGSILSCINDIHVIIKF